MPLSHLSDHSAGASLSRIDCVREGLEGPLENRGVWLRAAMARIEELEKHGDLFGLEEFERAELEELRKLAAQPIALY